MSLSREEFFEIVERTRAHEAAESIRGKYDGYRLWCQHVEENSKIFFQSTGAFAKDKRRKYIGMLEYNKETDIITYHKTGVIESKHKLYTNDSFGICDEVFQNLKVKDQILIEEKETNKQYSIGVSKVSSRDYKRFKQQGFETQLFIPKEDFKVTETKTNVVSIKRGKKK